MLNEGKVRTGGGSYNSEGPHTYFIASNPSTFRFLLDDLDRVYNHNKLIAVNEIKNPGDERLFLRMLRQGGNVFLDSGVFNLATTHAKNHGISHDQALRTPIDEVDNFDLLYNEYVRLVKTYEELLWGYVEIDAGGTEQKRKTRARLEDEGLRPIPVYHPLNDGHAYFDELASKYDRICVGNVVQASKYVRLRILATVYHRKQQYPGLWIHMLGMTPNEWINAFPVESTDSSTWLAAVRWPDAWRERASQKSISGFSEKYTYILRDVVSWSQALRAVAAQAEMNGQNWRNHCDRVEQLVGAREPESARQLACAVEQLELIRAHEHGHLA